MRTNTSLLFLLLLVLSSCGLKNEYHQFYPVSNSGWSKTDTLFFHIKNITDKPVSIDIDVRNTYQYKYENLILEVSHNLKDSTSYHVDTINIQLADSLGIWLGSGWGSLRQISHEFQKNLPHALSDSTFIKITHLMPDTLLIGLEDLGVLVSH